LVKESSFRVRNLSNSKVPNLHVPSVVEQDVVQLYVSMDDVFGVNVTNSLENLFEKIPCEIVVNLSSFSHIR